MRWMWLALLVAAGCPASLGANAPPLADTLAAARQSGRPVVLEMSASWCGPCKRFAKTILPDPRVQEALRDFTFVTYDGEQGNGVAVAQRYRVAAYPTFLAVDGDGQVVSTLRGLPSVDSFRDYLRWALVKQLDEDMLKRKLAADGSPATRLLGARWYASRGRMSDAAPLYQGLADDAIHLDPVMRTDVDWELHQVLAIGGSKAEFLAWCATYLATNPRARHAVEALELVVVGGGSGDLHALATDYLKAIADDPNALNDATYALIAGNLLDEALAAAERGLDLEKDDPAMLDTLAEVHHARGETAKAVALEDQALKGGAQAELYADLENNRARFAEGKGEPSIEVVTVRRTVAKYLETLQLK